MHDSVATRRVEVRDAFYLIFIARVLEYKVPPEPLNFQTARSIQYKT